ncbi:calcium/sodium antiporter [Botrimarina hoheduenensis]|uniref:Inner membrane protein YrbG n=1 Tax=Botrimarina hoheduenensis TaxID=2528000 RepID=A0A5C5VU02_9BACT|nr:calcium/sodium antiporter [Botrimarina hoheduenensis]TWT41395.1 Inner membrane protein YrbG [Botrimarina hoheduenensis]
MDNLVLALMILGGLVGLVVGGELLVRGASNLAAAARVPQLIIGLTVVALGTSAPELAVSVQSCYVGKTDLAVGNVVGSNLTNILLILGTAAVVAPLMVSHQLFRLDIPVMIAAAAALYALGSDGSISRSEGITLAILMVLYLSWTVVEGKRDAKRLEEELEVLTPQTTPSGLRAYALNLFLIVVGLVLLIGGANYLVEGCVQLATRWGVSELVIGLTIVAIGTSLPELVVSILASLRGKRDLAVGNVVGSNVLNILAVLGLSATVAPEGVNVADQSLRFDIPLMVAVSVACYPIFLTGKSVSRVEGIAMLLLYAAYLAWLVYSFGVLNEPPGYGSLAGFLTPLVLAMVWPAVKRRRLVGSSVKASQGG